MARARSAFVGDFDLVHDIPTATAMSGRVTDAHSREPTSERYR